MRFFLIILLAAFICSCSKNKIPEGILKPEKMQAVFWDFLKADIYTNDYISKDSTKDLKKENAQLQLKVFANHGISREKFYDSYDYYLNHTSLMKEMIDTMLVRQKKIPLFNTSPKSVQ